MYYGIPLTENREFCPKFAIPLACLPAALLERTVTGGFIVYTLLGIIWFVLLFNNIIQGNDIIEIIVAVIKIRSYDS